MKRLIHHLLIFVGLAVFIGGGVIGILAAMGACAAVWGEGIFDSALGSPPDHSHPAFWVFMLLMIPGMVVGFVKGAFFLRLFYALAAWQIGEGEEPNLSLWLKNVGGENK